MKWLPVAGAAVFAAIACPRPVMAVTEFCPAHLTPSAKTASTSADYAYTLDGQTPRTIVRARIIADTDGGWYGWHVDNVPLEKATEPLPGRFVYGTRQFARSAPLSVTFPKPLLVHHAWVTVARTNGELVMGWDAQGDFACEVPDFPDGGPGLRVVARRQAAATTIPSPAATAKAGIPAPVPQPFPIDCDRPFALATVVRPVQPDFPYSARGGSYTAVVEVAIGDNDDLVDAWTYASSRNTAIDLSALRAAKLSSYASPTSYCRKVAGYYLFRAEFR